MKRLSSPHAVLAAALFILLLTFQSSAQEQTQSQPQMQQAQQAQPAPASAVAITGNQEVIDLLKAGMSPAVVVAKIKASLNKFDTSPAALQELKAAGAPYEVIVAIIEAAAPKKEELPAAKRRVTDELTGRFRELESTLVTVWSEIGHGTGFIFDGRGLVMTNQHVIGPSELVSVQFDAKTKVPARVLVLDPQRDVAVLWVDLSLLPKATVAKIAKATESEPTLVQGERVMTIGSPLSQRKIMTTGVASKIEARGIIFDININPGN